MTRKKKGKTIRKAIPSVVFHKGVPPKTLRFCPRCNEKTEFEYNRIICHSECIVCGFRWMKL